MNTAVKTRIPIESINTISYRTGGTHRFKDVGKKNSAEVKATRGSYLPDIVDELAALGFSVPSNGLRREIAATPKSREKLPPADIPTQVVEYMTRQRITEQLAKGKKLLGEGNLTYSMEEFLRRKGVPIEVQPQRWKSRQELL